MTWGEVENTPLRVEGSDTPYVDRTPGPAFKVGRRGGWGAAWVYGDLPCSRGCAQRTGLMLGRAPWPLVRSGPPLRTGVDGAWAWLGDGWGAPVAPGSLQVRRTGLFRDGGLGPGARLQLGRSPETLASIGHSCALGMAESLQREASGYGGSRLGGPGQGPRSSQRGGSRGRALTREALCGPGRQGIWVVGGVWGRGGPGRCQRVAGRARVALGRQVRDVAGFVGKASTGRGL